MAGARAADDFVVIRTRMEELRRQRDRAVRGEDEPGPKPYHRPLDKGSAEIEERGRFRPFRERFTS
jgi:hypothetical protein